MQEDLFLYLSAQLLRLNPDYETSLEWDYMKDFIQRYTPKSSSYICPADMRILSFLKSLYPNETLQHEDLLPLQTLTLDQPGLARILSLPQKKSEYISEYMSSYRVYQGVLHNPKHDRRTTLNSFHVVDYDLPVPYDKIKVSLPLFKQMLIHALQPPKELLQIPFTSDQPVSVESFVSLYLRPIVSPAYQDSLQKRMDIRFFAPGSCVANLDFVEHIFGHGGSPFDLSLDASYHFQTWSGHTGCVLLAPHLVTMTKKQLGFPKREDATQEDLEYGFYYDNPHDYYNDGNAFKMTVRSREGVIVTLIADSYFGYCKKEVKSQISFSCNLMGNHLEEHSGGALVLPRYDVGESYDPSYQPTMKHWEHTCKVLGKEDWFDDTLGVQQDPHVAHLFYIPETCQMSLSEFQVRGTFPDGKTFCLDIDENTVFMLPNGDFISLEQDLSTLEWRLVRTSSRSTFCHKPCTVSGGGKSEISKPIDYSMISRPVYVYDLKEDFKKVREILQKDFSQRFASSVQREDAREILSFDRSLGSVIQLFTPSSVYNHDYNAWLESLEPHIKNLIFVLKRLYCEDWGEDWESFFSVSFINGSLGHQLLYRNQPCYSHYLRVGHHIDGSDRIFRVRTDFRPSLKVQMEDDISVSKIVPNSVHQGDLDSFTASLKIVENCESYLFQRPDDSVVPGYDVVTELDLVVPGTFLSNYEPMTREAVQKILKNPRVSSSYTKPVQKMMLDFIQQNDCDYLVVPSEFRILKNGNRTSNPRYLQKRPDHTRSDQTYIAGMSQRLRRGLSPEKFLDFPVDAVLMGRRGNFADYDKNLPPLAIYNPLHYQDIPELMMDIIVSLTGKSPSTTGFGSEGALTKGPFNALSPAYDLNTIFLDLVLTKHAGFSSAAGAIGAFLKVDHDISLLVPEIWSRMTAEECSPEYLIKNQYLESCYLIPDIPGASLLGYRITASFVKIFLGRIFSDPHLVFDEWMLQPEKQDQEQFMEGLHKIQRTYQTVAQHYLEAGHEVDLCPPLQKLLSIMVTDDFDHAGLQETSFRELFSLQSVLNSDWYRERLLSQHRAQYFTWNHYYRSLEYLYRNYPLDSTQKSHLEEQRDLIQNYLNHHSDQPDLKINFGSTGNNPFF